MELPLLLPQKPPVVMVDTLLECSDTGARAGLYIHPDNIFVQNGFFTEPGLVENIAQTAAAQAGCLGVSAGRSEAQLGYIAAVDHLEIRQLPAVHTRIETTVEVKAQVLNVTIIRGTVTQDGEPLVLCEMKIFAQP